MVSPALSDKAKASFSSGRMAHSASRVAHDASSLAQEVAVLRFAPAFLHYGTTSKSIHWWAVEWRRGASLSMTVTMST